MMRQQGRNGVLLLTTLSLLFVAPPRSGASEKKLNGALSKAQIDQIERLLTAYMAKAEIPGLSIAVVRAGKLVWSTGYGFADLENHVPAKASTAYRTASIGKTITATAALHLVEEGKLDLDQPIQRYCPAFPVKQA